MKTKEKLIPDIGIVAALDPIALDMATLDLTRKYNPDNLSRMAFPQRDPLIQIEHGVKLGMGSKQYRLVEIEIP
jgi:hypothetical protein